MKKNTSLSQKKYTKNDLDKIPELFCEAIMALETPHDFLGETYMTLGLGNHNNGQFFTPNHIAKLMASICHTDVFNSPDSKDFITLHDPACGAGAMIIAYVDYMREQGFNPQQQLWVSCIDIDPLVAKMCYIQLSLLHIPAEIFIGDTLSMEINQVLRTPTHYLGCWSSKLKKH